YSSACSMALGSVMAILPSVGVIDRHGCAAALGPAVAQGVGAIDGFLAAAQCGTTPCPSRSAERLRRFFRECRSCVCPFPLPQGVRGLQLAALRPRGLSVCNRGALVFGLAGFHGML